MTTLTEANHNDVDADGNTVCDGCGNRIPADARCPHCYVLSDRLRIAAREDERVRAIRADALIGEHSCSFVDECLIAFDIVEELDRLNIETPLDTIKHYIKAQDRQYEQGLNARAGNDDDPELIQYHEWRTSLDAHMLTLAS